MCRFFWTPNMGCNIRVDLTTGVPEYSSYMKSPSWMARRGLRTIGEDGKAFYQSRTSRVFPKNIPVAHLKVRPDDIPRHPGHQDTAAYFSFEERAVVDILEGQLAFLSAVRDYEKKHVGCHLLQPHLTWKIEFLNCFLGALDGESLDTLHEEIRLVSNMRYDHSSWAVRTSKDMSRILRHEKDTRLGNYVEASMEELQRMKLRPFEWEPRKFFACAPTLRVASMSGWHPRPWSSIVSTTGTSRSESVPSRVTVGSRSSL